MSLRFYTALKCPFAQRVAIVLAEKHVAHEVVTIDLNNMPEWYVRDINPRRTVPALAVGDEILHESLPIAHYLDATKAPFNALFPTDVAVRARIRAFQALCSNLVGALFRTLRATPEEQAAANANLTTVAAEVEKAFTMSSAGPFFLGSTFSMADVTIVTMLHRFRYLLPAYAGMELYEVAPRLFAMLLAAMERESVRSTSIGRDALVAAYASFANVKKARAVLQLRGAKGDPFAQSVQLAAAAKGIELEFVATKDDTVVLAPLGEVPIASTGFALQHLEDLHPEPALADATSHAAAAALTHSALVFSQVSDELATYAYQQVAADDAGLKAALATIEGLVRGPFCAGAVPTQGDYLLAAVVKKLPAGATGGFPKVAAAFEGVKALPKVAEFKDW